MKENAIGAPFNLPCEKKKGKKRGGISSMRRDFPRSNQRTSSKKKDVEAHPNDAIR